MRFIKPKEVLELVGISRTTLWRLCRAGTFPQPVRITKGRAGFVLEAVLEWMDARVSGDRERHRAEGSPTHDEEAAGAAVEVRARLANRDHPARAARGRRRREPELAEAGLVVGGGSEAVEGDEGGLLGGQDAR